MKELAESLKRHPGLRIRQGVVTARDGVTCSVLVGGSEVPIEGVQHLDSCDPAVDQVVWLASDGADLWILGTHGAPPPIDLARLPAFETYFLAADPAGDPDPPEDLVVTALATGLLIRWDLSPEAIWRRWDIEIDLDDEFPAPATVSTSLHVNTVPLAAESGPWYVRVRAWNTRDEASEWVTAPGSYAIPARTDWSAMPQITETKIADGAISTPKLQAESVTAAKVDVEDLQAAIVTAEVVNALELNAGSIAAGTIDTARLDVGEILASEITAADITGGSIAGVSITGQVITGGEIRTDSDGPRIELATRGNSDYGHIGFYAGFEWEIDGAPTPGGLFVKPNAAGDGSKIYLQPAVFDFTKAYPRIGLYTDADGSAKLALTDGVAGDWMPNFSTCGIVIGDGMTRVHGDLKGAAGTLYIGDNVQVSGKVLPSDFASGVSDDGVWIQEGSAAASGWDARRRWKLYYDTANHRLFVRYSGSDYAYFTATARAGVA